MTTVCTNSMAGGSERRKLEGLQYYAAKLMYNTVSYLLTLEQLFLDADKGSRGKLLLNKEYKM